MSYNVIFITQDGQRLYRDLSNWPTRRIRAYAKKSRYTIAYLRFIKDLF